MREEARRAGRKDRNALVASAVLMTGPERSNAPMTTEAWQTEIWDYYDTVEELQFGGTWTSNALSRVNLVAARPPRSQGEEPQPIDLDDQENPPTRSQRRAVELVAQIAGGVAGQGQILAAAALNLMLTGVCYLHVKSENDVFTEWRVCSCEEVKRVPGMTPDQPQLQVTNPETGEWEDIGPNDLLIKCWRSHPRKRHLPHSPAKACRRTLAEIVGYGDRIEADTTSRLVGNGLLVIPEEWEFAPLIPTGTPADATDSFVTELLQVASIATQDRSSPAARLPLPIRGPGETADKIRHVTFSSQPLPEIDALRMSAIKRLALGLDMPPEVLLGMGESNHWPMAGHTEVYTRRGWLTWDRLVAGSDEAWTVDHETGSAGWQPILEVPHEPVVDRPMVRIDRRYLTATSTLDHRWPVMRDGERVWTTGAGIEPDDRAVKAAPAADWPEVPTFTDDLVQLAAWFSADGTLTRPGGSVGQIRIGKSWKRNPHLVAELRGVLERLFGPASVSMPRGMGPSFRVEHQGRGMEMFVLNAAARDVLLGAIGDQANKAIPTSFVDKLTRAQAEMFLHAWTQSDGMRGQRCVGQADRGRLASVEYAALRCGYAVAWNRQEPTSGAFGSQGLHVLRWSDSPRMTSPMFGETTVVAYTGEIFCLRTPPNASWLARDGHSVFFTGNSAWQVAEEAITLHVEPLAEAIVQAITIGFLHAAMKGENLDLTDTMVWYDTTDLTTRPDRSQAAQAAYDDGVLKVDAYLTEIGLDPSQALVPGTDEYRVRLLLKAAGGAPTLAPYAYYLAGVITEEQALAWIASANQPAPGDPSAGDAAPDAPPATQPADRAIPETDQGDDAVDSAALLAFADGLVTRALEKAGAKLSNAIRKSGQNVTCTDPSMLHTQVSATEFASVDALLDGAWDRVPTIAGRLGMGAESLHAVLDAYTRTILVNGHAHEYDRLGQALGVSRDRSLVSA